MNRPRSSRRQFLTGEAALDAVGDLGRSLADSHASAASTNANSAASGPTSTAAPRVYLVQYTRRAMACLFEVFLNAGQHEGAAEHAVAALDLVDRLEDQLTVYRAHSEISRLNQFAQERAVPVEARLFDLLEKATQLHAETDGAFDITAGPLIQAWGFLRREGRIPDAEALAEALARTGSRHLQLDTARRTLRFAQPGVSINLGAIGKGYALDRCAEYLTLAGVYDYMIHAGSSSVLARGHRQGDRNDAGWTIGIQHPLRADRRLAEFQLRDRAVGTSGAGTQHFYHQGKRYGHIIDPRTGQPADRVLSTTVIAPTGAAADALATAFYVLGLEGASRYCETHPDVTALVTVASQRAGSVDLHALNAESLEWRRIDDAP